MEQDVSNHANSQAQEHLDCFSCEERGYLPPYPTHPFHSLPF